MDYSEFVVKNKEIVKSRSLISDDKIEDIIRYLDQTSSVEGNVAECGVYKGGSAFYICEWLRTYDIDKRVHLLDTFNGIPCSNPQKGDTHKVGDFCDVDLDDVRSFLSDYDDMTDYHVGDFRDTFSKIDPDEKFSLIHVDCDVYDSVMATCRFFYNKMPPGAIMLFDDTASPTCRGSLIALHEFTEEKNIKFETIRNGHHFFVKE